MGSRSIASTNNITSTGQISGGSVVSSGLIQGSSVELTSGIKIGDDSGVCNSTKAGTLRYNGALLFCTGTEWKVVKLETAAASLAISPTSQAGMNITGGTSPGSYFTFTISNNGTLTSSSISTSLSNTTNFETGTNNCHGNTLAAGATCSIQVRAKATLDGAYSGNLTISADNTVSSALSGSASGFTTIYNWANNSSQPLIAWNDPTDPSNKLIFAVPANSISDISGNFQYSDGGAYTTFTPPPTYYDLPGNNKVRFNGVDYNGYIHSSDWSKGNTEYSHRVIWKGSTYTTSSGEVNAPVNSNYSGPKQP